jgi:hypothetical protein
MVSITFIGILTTNQTNGHERKREGGEWQLGSLAASVEKSGKTPYPYSQRLLWT